jgi:hypothetical protein
LPARTEAEFHTHNQQHYHQYQSGSESAIADPDFDGEYHSDNDNPEVQLQPIPSQPDLGLTGQKLTSGETAHLAATFCIVWFAANWTVNASLGLTSVGSSTVLAGMSGESLSHGRGVGYGGTVVGATLSRAEADGIVNVFRVLYVGLGTGVWGGEFHQGKSLGRASQVRPIAYHLVSPAGSRLIYVSIHHSQLHRSGPRHPLRLAARFRLDDPAGRTTRPDGTRQEAHVGGRFGIVERVLLCHLRYPSEG